MRDTERNLLKLIAEASRVSTHAADLLRICRGDPTFRELNEGNVEWYLGSIMERMASINGIVNTLPDPEELYEEYSKPTTEDI